MYKKKELTGGPGWLTQTPVAKQNDMYQTDKRVRAEPVCRRWRVTRAEAAWSRAGLGRAGELWVCHIKALQ